MAKILNIFNWIAAIVLSFIYSLLLMSTFLFSFTNYDNKRLPETIFSWKWGLIFIIGIAIFLVLILVWYGFSLLLKKINFDRKNIFRFFLIIIVAIPLIILWQESPSIPIENDYSWEDVITPPKNAKESYATFIKLLDVNIDYSSTNIPWNEKVSGNNAIAIEKCWGNNSELHNWINEVNSYDEIADLTVEFDDAYRKMTSPLIKFSKIYFLYAKLKIEQNDFKSAADSLLKLNSIVQRSSPYSRTLIHQMILSAIEGKVLTYMNTLITSENCPPEIIKELKKSVSMINQIYESRLISEYLVTKTYLENGQFIVYERPDFLTPVTKFAARFMIDNNTLFQIKKQSTDIFISCINSQPVDFTPFNEHIEQLKNNINPENPIEKFLSVEGELENVKMHNSRIRVYNKRKELIEKLQKM